MDQTQIRFVTPASFGGIRVNRSDRSEPLGGERDEAAKVHAAYPVFFQVKGCRAGDSIGVLNAVMEAVRLWSGHWIVPRRYVDADSDHAFVNGVPSVTPAIGWGHTEGAIDAAALRFATRAAPRLFDLMYTEKFNRLGNALRLYESAVRLTPCDVAVVVFMSVLEGLFTTSTQELSFRLSLAVSNHLGGSRDTRRETYRTAHNLYGIRSNIVHGGKIDKDEEAAAIACENYANEAADLARRCLLKLFTNRLDRFVEQSKKLDEYYVLRALGYSAAEAMRRCTSGN